MARFLADNTLFVTGIKALPKHRTNSLKVLLHLIDHEDLELIVDDVLKREYEKYGKKFGGKKTGRLIQSLLDKAREVEPEKRFIRIVKPYFNDESDPEDMIHAATTLQEDATIITNDSDFQEIREEEILEIWDHTKAMQEFGMI